MQEETKKEHTATEKQPEKKKVNLDIRPYLAIGLTVILIVVSASQSFLWYFDLTDYFRFPKDFTESSGHFSRSDRGISA